MVKSMHVGEPGHVLVLGAGFSRAVSAHTPLAEALGRQALAWARHADPGLFSGAPPLGELYPFEVWLSLLAGDQPQLDEPENRKNAARFARMSEALVAVLREAQRRALATDPPAWLYELLSVLHEERSVVISLNYDALLETAVNSMHLGPGQLSGPKPYWPGAASRAVQLAPVRVGVADILQDRPSRATAAEIAETATPATFRLLKLHGSLDWWWTPGDLTGASFLRAPTVEVFGQPTRGADKVLGREPFIVPPLAIKSHYYANPLTREIWREAFAALRNATRVTLVGYSLPQTDIVISGMLSEALSSSEAKIEIINPDARSVQHRLAALSDATAMHDVTSMDTEDCIADYVGALIDDLSRRTAGGLSALQPTHRPEDPDPVLVSWSSRGAPTNHTVIEIERQADETVLLRASPGMRLNEPGLPATVDLVSAVKNAARVTVQSQDGQSATVIGFTASDFDNPHARHIVSLIPAGQLRASQ